MFIENEERKWHITVRNLIGIMQDWTFIEIPGKLCGESPSLSGCIKDIPEDIYKQIVDKEVLGADLLEDSDGDEHRVYGFKIYYNDMKLELEDEI